MNHLFVDRSTEGKRITPVSLERRLCSPSNEPCLGKAVELQGLHAGLALLPQRQQGLRNEPAGPPYPIDLPQRLVLNGTAEW